MTTTRDLRKAVLLPILLAAAGGDAALAASPAVPAGRIGPYRLLSEIGSGGMGRVYLAEQSVPVLRHVALKVVHPDALSPELVARFHLERQLLAVAEHEHVARMYDAGTTADDVLWFTMEYVPGEPITDYCDRQRLDVPERLRLLADVCDAVHHLHGLGIQHRDLKPDNVLVVERDGRPVPKIIDLGLATVAGRDGTGDDDGLVGTPTHMAPEQLTAPPAEIDERADVHALGVMLYELVVGALPYPTIDWTRPGGVESLTIGRHVLPPSARLRDRDVDAAAVSATRRTTKRRLAHVLRRGLDQVARRAVAPDRDDRHATARELAGELRMHADRAGARRTALRVAATAALAAAAGVLGGALVAAAL